MCTTIFPFTGGSCEWKICSADNFETTSFMQICKQHGNIRSKTRKKPKNLTPFLLWLWISIPTSHHFHEFYSCHRNHSPSLEIDPTVTQAPAPGVASVILALKPVGISHAAATCQNHCTYMSFSCLWYYTKAYGYNGSSITTSIPGFPQVIDFPSQAG